MSGTINNVHLIGNLGNDVELKWTQGGQAVAKFSLATTETWKDRDGNKKEETSWHRVVVFGKLGEICNEYLKKGSKVYVQGRLKYGKYEKDDVTHYTTDILAEQMRMLDGKRDDQQHGGARGGGKSGDKPASQRPTPSAGGFKGDFADDDIPF